MKEFLRFLMCLIIIATLVFVYMFLTDQNNNYSNNIGIEDTNDVSVGIENSGDKEVENIFSGDDLKNDVESGESIDKLETNNNKPVIEDNKKDEYKEEKTLEEIQENKTIAKPELSGDTLLSASDEKVVSGD